LNCAELVSGLAKEKGKIAAVTETGGPISNNTQWWTQLLETLKPFDLSYVLVWRNPWQETSHANFAPYKGSPDAPNFVEFYNDPKTLFQKEVTKKNLYKQN
jgi:mannan endo-1,4-beta-mannosidase